MDITAARARLEAMLADLDRSIAVLKGERPGDDAQAGHYDRDPADAGADLSDADRMRAMLEVAERQRAEVRAALERIEHGTYGRCVDCGKPVPEARLEARPEAACCVTCQARHDNRRR